ncbi:MAG: aspartate kinase [Euryarchaeota archaeon]|nr:aspartate kinase [Euryarchaeota archaeon]
MIKVMKFGGSSMGNIDALKRTSSIIANDPAKKVIVVSAMSGVTNYLIKCISERPDPSSMIDHLKHKYHTAVQDLLSGDHFKVCMQEIDTSLSALSEQLKIRWEADSDPVLEDRIFCWGERLSAILLSNILAGRGISSVAMSSEEAGIIAEGTPTNGSADLELTHANLSRTVIPLLDKGITPVITGYYGVNNNGNPVTFGRGGSDYSGSVIANCIDADCYEVWTDVDGFMTSDPRIVPEARTVDEMDYGEAAELAYFGAKVLHPRTVEPVRQKSIPLIVKNTFNPDGHGTLVRNQKCNSTEIVRSVASKGDLSIIKIYSSEIVYNPGLISRLIASVSEAAVNTYAISTSLSTLAVVLPTPAIPCVLSKLNALHENQIEKMTVKNNVSLICCVGDNMINTFGVAAKVFSTVSATGANVEMISEGASDVALNFMVPSEMAEDVIRSIHRKFIGG